MQTDLTDYGHAHGDYQRKCVDCEAHHTADKRSIRCVLCATIKMQSAEITRLTAALARAEKEARRFAEMYPKASDGRNTFIILADKIVAMVKP